MRARRFLRVVTVASAATVLVLAGSATALAQSDGLDHNDQVILNGTLTVPKGETVGSAVILNGPARIYGTVQETLFVLNGHVDVGGTVEQDVVVVNGTLVVHTGAHIGGDVVTQTTPTIQKGATIDGRERGISTNVDIENLGFASRFVWWLGFSASTLFLGLLLLLLVPALDPAIVAAWRERAGASVGWGAAVFFLFPVIAVLFLVTIVGIPLGLYMLLGLALVYTVGYVAGAQVLGRLLVRPPRSRFLAFLAGWAILRVVALVPILGGFVFLIASLVGLGALLVAGRRPAAYEGVAGEAPPPPPPPVPAAV